MTMRTTNDILFPNTPSKEDGDMIKDVTVIGREESWECDLDMVKSCGKVPDKVTVLISPLVKRKIDFLMNKYKGLEWLAYLLGEGLSVKDLFIPSQTVSAGNVHVDPETELPKTPMIGVIHSHHSMGAFFSSTDDEYINSNHNISIVVSKDQAKAQVRLKTPCGALKTVEANVVLDFKAELNEEEFEKMLDEVITTPYVGRVYRQYDWQNWGDNIE